jgi:hypothetical protein
VLIAVLLLVPAAAGATTWKERDTVANNEGWPAPTMTVDRHGDSVFAWRDDRGLWERSRPARGALTPGRLLGPGAKDAAPIAGNAPGDAVLAWADGVREVVALRSRSGDFGAPQTLYDGATTEHVCDQAAAISDSGEALVVVSVVANGAQDPFACRVYAAVRSPGSSTFAAPVRLSDATGENVHVAMDRRGSGLVVWGDRHAGTIEVVRHAAGGGFAPAQALTVPGEAATPGIRGPLLVRVSARTGRAIVAFQTVRRNSYPTAAAAIGDTTHGFGAAARLGIAPLGLSQYFVAAAGSDGTLATAWRGGSGSKRHWDVARFGPHTKSASKRATVTLPAVHPDGIAMAIGGSGLVTVAYARLTSYRGPRSVEVVAAKASAPFPKAQVLSRRGGVYGAEPTLAISSSGRRFITWFDERKRRRTLRWASASAGARKFGRAQVLLRGDHDYGQELVRGARGAMLDLVHTVSSAWELFTYGER